MELKSHDLVDPRGFAGVRYEDVPLEDVPGLHAVRITLDNPGQLNSYTTEMVRGVIAGMRAASNDRAAVAVIFTGAGDEMEAAQLRHRDAHVRRRLVFRRHAIHQPREGGDGGSDVLGVGS